MKPTNSLLRIEDLGFAYEGRRLFTNLNLELRPCNALQILGANGAGKSTLLKVLAGLLNPTWGRVLWQDQRQSFAPTSLEMRRAMVYLPAEGNGFFHELGWQQNLRFWCHLKGQPWVAEVVHDMLSTWNLDHPLLVERPLAKWSTGMRRRLAMIRLELSGAILWLLDEPLYGLDSAGLDEFQKMTQRHLANGGMICMVSHDHQAWKDLDSVVPIKIGT